MLEAVKFPASIADLNTGLTDVDRNALSHFSQIQNLRAKLTEIIKRKRKIKDDRRLSRRLSKCELRVRLRGFGFYIWNFFFFNLG